MALLWPVHGAIDLLLVVVLFAVLTSALAVPLCLVAGRADACAAADEAEALARRLGDLAATHHEQRLPSIPISERSTVAAWPVAGRR